MTQVIASNRNRNRSIELERIAAALLRLQKAPQEYGLCLDCGEPIPPKRLDIMPFAELCAGCQQDKDESKLPSGRRHLTDFK
jgi:DnaK suppressor protein